MCASANPAATPAASRRGIERLAFRLQGQRPVEFDDDGGIGRTARRMLIDMVAYPPKAICFPHARVLKGPRMDLAKYIRDIPDFPKPGILFKDITPLLAEPRAFQEAIDRLYERYCSGPHRRHRGR